MLYFLFLIKLLLVSYVGFFFSGKNECIFSVLGKPRTEAIRISWSVTQEKKQVEITFQCVACLILHIWIFMNNTIYYILGGIPPFLPEDLEFYAYLSSNLPFVPIVAKIHPREKYLISTLVPVHIGLLFSYHKIC